MDTWLNVLENRREIDKLNGAIDPKIIRDETPHRIERLTELSHRVFGEFIKAREPIVPSLQPSGQ